MNSTSICYQLEVTRFPLSHVHSFIHPSIKERAKGISYYKLTTYRVFSMITRSQCTTSQLRKHGSKRYMNISELAHLSKKAALWL